MEIVCMAEQIGVIENILRNGKRMWGGGWKNCKDGGKTYNKGKTEMLDKTILPPYRLMNLLRRMRASSPYGASSNTLKPRLTP